MIHTNTVDAADATIARLPNLRRGKGDIIDTARHSKPAIDSEEAYDKAVAEGKDIAARMDRDWRQLGELAHQVGREWGEEKLKDFAKDTGIPYGTVKRERSVFRAYKDIGAPEPRSYSVAKELATHPDRAKILQQHPQLTKAEAHKLICAYRKKERGNVSWRRKEIEDSLDALAGAAKTAQRSELKLVKNAADYRLLKELTAQRSQFAAELRKGAAALLRSADLIDQLDQHIADAERDGPSGKAEEEAAEMLARERRAATGNDFAEPARPASNGDLPIPNFLNRTGAPIPPAIDTQQTADKREADNDASANEEAVS
jgi:hypothetical protein